MTRKKIDRAFSDESKVGTVLAAWAQGNAEALERLIPLVMQKLQEQARYLLLRESVSCAPEKLVSDLYIRLRALRSPSFGSVAAFYYYSMLVMRHILVDRARARRADKRGGQLLQVDMNEEEMPSAESTIDALLTFESILEDLPPTVKEIAYLRWAGYTRKEIAEHLMLTPGAVSRHWDRAKHQLLEKVKLSYGLVVRDTERPLSPDGVIKPVVTLDLVSPELIRSLALHPELMRTMDWRAFEYLLSTILEKLEYDVELQRGTKDGGIDIFAIKKGGPLGPHRYLLQAKRWKAAVDVQPVRELLFLRDQHRVTKACLATTSRSTRGAWRLADEYKWVLELRDYFGIQEWIKLCNAG